MTRINKINNCVKLIMQQVPTARNYDKDLIWEYWKREGTVVDGTIDIDAWKEATSPMSISRARRNIQNGGALLPTKVDVVKERLYNRKRWEKAFKGETQPELF